MKSAFRLLAGGLVWLGLALAAAPSQAISVVGNLGWQAIPATCSVATNVRFTLADRKLRFECGPTSVQFSCTPAAAVSYGLSSQQVSVACVSNTISAVGSTWSPFPGAPSITCGSMTDFDFNTEERTVTFTCPSISSQPRTCYTSALPPTPDFVTGTVALGYCPEAAFELIGHAGFEEGELWRPNFGQSP